MLQESRILLIETETIYSNPVSKQWLKWVKQKVITWAHITHGIPPLLIWLLVAPPHRTKFLYLAVFVFSRIWLCEIKLSAKSLNTKYLV